MVLDRIQEVARGALDDGLVFEVDDAVADTIRDQDQYCGTRVSMACQLAKARIAFHVDVSVGAPISPSAGMLRLPRLLGGQIDLLAYPLSMVFAKKVVTAMERRLANTRRRDFADIYLLSRHQAIDGNELQDSLQVVADHRGVSLAPLAVTLGGIVAFGETRWRAWARKQKLDDRLPDFGTVIAAVSAFADPAITGRVKAMVWNHLALEWQES
ncbi:nucleotidyl transferase AbiEii/AbiGii toxin family protein [Kribbella qitaiheensis]|uniref:nucleotidyl transferase AbiEii/AbiGii toxin family protein n=1 Tax=Kribbella qitaiheensis TaxID=1544730 RepID=UPI0031B57E1D